MEENQKRTKNTTGTYLIKAVGVSVILSVVGAAGIFCLLSLNKDQFFLPNLLFFPCLITCCIFWLKCGTGVIIKSDIFFSLVMSMVLTFGIQLGYMNHLDFGLRFVLSIFCSVAAIYPFVQMIKMLAKEITKDNSFQMTEKNKRIVFLLMLMVNLAAWVILFPGIYTYDMASWNEMFSKGIISSHWSITYGLYLAMFLDLGKLVFNNYSTGFALAMLIQAVFVSYVYFRIIMFAAEKAQNKWAAIVSILFFIMNPFLVVMSITDAQDVVFGCLFSLIILDLYEALSEKNNFSRKSGFVALLLLCMLMITIRNNGVYCLAVSIPFLLFCKKIHNRKKLVAVMAISILFSVIYNGPFLKALNTQESTAINEMLSVPSQQLAKVYFEEPGCFSSEEVKELGRFYDLDGEFKLYKDYPLIADYTKGSLDSEYTSQHIGEFMRLYFDIGFKSPRKYIEAFLLNSIGFWMPGKDYNDKRIDLDYMNYPGFTMTAAYTEANHDAMKAVIRMNDGLLARTLDEVIFRNGWYELPIISFLCSMGWYWMILFYLIVISVRYRNNIVLTAVSPAIGLFLTLLLAPVAIYRYVYPIAIMIPLFFVLACTSTPDTGHKREHSA